ncbi:serine/threonine protein kinase [Glutamicibacter sp. MNS18]|uniref:serine/threonine-protein kinase n=1 Tax=Glutamicibacter sp. MNS18 TaxID=2989817 RepID=UPI00223681F8|nr:serine/threonine-protein kinase [Glutamicibacter sp. MNS18]MCW4466709.1 serine/threonine protein kinase [Glutamicibacter sp. MNS18]
MAAEVIAGRFELIEHIAEGGSGSVWLARDLQRSSRCAAKVMKQSYSGEILRFVREQGVKFDHPYLLTPYGWAAVDDRVLIASQLMRGGNLHTAMQDYGAFSPELVAEILAQLLDGLGHVHASGWVHRDVKPANVLLETTAARVPKVRLTDFGIATHQDAPRLTEVGLTVGTEGFLAPEQRAGKEPDAAQDLYALGALAVQLLDPTLRGESLRRRCTELATSHHDLPSAPLGPVLAGLLDTDPGVREDTAGRALEQLHPLRNRQGYRVASGEVFEVFDHFADDGLHPSDPEAEPEASTRAETRPPAPAQRSAPQDTSPGPKGRPPWQPWVFLLVALLLGAVSLWLVYGQDTDQGASDAANPAPQATGTPQAPDAETTRATDRPDGTESQQPAAPATTAAHSATSTALEVGISSTARRGQECTALEEGLTVDGADGLTLVCMPEGAAHRWQEAD